MIVMEDVLVFGSSHLHLLFCTHLSDSKAHALCSNTHDTLQSINNLSRVVSCMAGISGKHYTLRAKRNVHHLLQEIREKTDMIPAVPSRDVHQVST